MKHVYEGVLAVIFCLLLWLLLFLGGLALLLPGPVAHPWALLGLNPLLLYLLQGLYLGLSLALAVAVAWLLGRWFPFLRRGLSSLEAGWQRLWS